MKHTVCSWSLDTLPPPPPPTHSSVSQDTVDIGSGSINFCSGSWSWTHHWNVTVRVFSQVRTKAQMTARTIFIIYFAFISGGIPAFLIFIVILYTLTSEYFSRELRRAVPGAEPIFSIKGERSGDPGGLMWIISLPFVANFRETLLEMWVTGKIISSASLSSWGFAARHFHWCNHIHTDSVFWIESLAR